MVKLRSLGVPAHTDAAGLGLGRAKLDHRSRKDEQLGALSQCLDFRSSTR